MCAYSKEPKIATTFDLLAFFSKDFIQSEARSTLSPTSDWLMSACYKTISLKMGEIC